MCVSGTLFTFSCIISYFKTQIHSHTKVVLRGDWPVKFWSQNVPEQVFVFFQVWVPKHAYFHLSQYFYDICLIFMQMKTFFEP